MATPKTNGPAVTGQNQFNSPLKEDAAKNSVPVHTFDPQTSPQQKGAAAGQASDKINGMTQDNKSSDAKGIPNRHP
jgi:hypothetical protein